MFSMMESSAAWRGTYIFFIKNIVKTMNMSNRRERFQRTMKTLHSTQNFFLYFFCIRYLREELEIYHDIRKDM